MHIVNPTPVNIATPYMCIQFDRVGIFDIFSFIQIYVNKNTPSCFPTKRPNIIPSDKFVIRFLKLSSLKSIPVFKKTNKGKI